MGTMVEFASNGKTCSGYLATAEGKGPGVVVIQEWWGLVEHIKQVTDRLASEGFVALAPDLYHGETTKEPDESSKKMMELRIEDAGRDMAGAFDYLKQHESVEPKKIGGVGFCMGGALSIVLATLKPVDACVSFYGIPVQPVDYSKISGALLLHVAGHDDWVTTELAEQETARMREAGVDAQSYEYPSTEHAFFNDHRPEVYNAEAAEQGWGRTLELFRERLV